MSVSSIILIFPIVVLLLYVRTKVRKKYDIKCFSTSTYLLFKYLRPQALEKQGINSFDAWAAVFARKSTDYEFSITNDIILKERFRTFIKVPELAAFYAEVWE